MWLRPSFLVPLKAEIKSEFFSVFGKTVAIPDEKLADFVQNSGFTDLISASAHFRRVIKYYSDKYTYIPTFNHLISERLPVLQDTSEWVHKMHASFPQFRPYLFSPAKSAAISDMRPCSTYWIIGANSAATAICWAWLRRRTVPPA